MPFNDYEIAGAPAAADVGTAKRRAEYQAQLRVRTPGVRVADSQWVRQRRCSPASYI